MMMGRDIFKIDESRLCNSPKFIIFCEAQARVRQGSARDGSQGERPKSLNPCQELTLKLVVTHHHPPISLILLN